MNVHMETIWAIIHTISLHHIYAYCDAKCNVMYIMHMIIWRNAIKTYMVGQYRNNIAYIKAVATM
jgi:hypothetical protein